MSTPQETIKTLEARYPEGFWDVQEEYLSQSYVLMHNDDYLEFLVKQVWKLNQVICMVEFGCGYGRMGLKLIPLLPAGSTYTGFDHSAELIAKGLRVWAKSPWLAELSEGDIFAAPYPDQSFDVTLAHAVLMHVPHPELALQEMIRVTKPGGLVITCDANRNAHSALFHIEEINRQETVRQDLFQAINREIRLRTGVDHNIGMKTPVLMERAGLKNVQARISDVVRVLVPPLDTDDKKHIYSAICNEGYGQPKPDEAKIASWKANLLSYGISEADAEAEIARELDEDFLCNGPAYHTVYATLLTWSFGVV